ncbi:NAD(P)-binding protein [Cadophora sp. DSE1049]|nr:NAD(P)-binding protein [Cadophora sp. DSE1049]
MLALTSCTGKLGKATLDAILEHNLIPLQDLVICTSSSTSDSRWDTLKSQGVKVRSFNFDTSSPSAFKDCTSLYLISTPNISMDFNNAPPGSGREKAHIGAIKVAREAGVTSIFYTSLAFGSDSGAGVMRAHLRTEEFLKDLQEKDNVKVTVMREGLYNESWPLYLGYFDPKGDERAEVILPGDGKISWTAIKDLGLASALVLADRSGRFEGKTFYLSRREGPRSLSDIARLVGEARGKEVSVRVVGREEYVEACIKRSVERASVEWWSSTYAALESRECLIDDPTLDELLASRGVKPTPVEDTVREML